MYSVNDTVVYGTHGICRIACVESHNFTGTMKDYYVLKPVGDEKSTIYVCVSNEKAVSQMRAVLSEEEIYQLLQSMPDEPSRWIENKNERNERCRQILNRGDRKELLMMIKTLYLHKQQQKKRGKKMHLTDEKYLKDAEKMLHDEFAVVLNISPDQVVPFIRKQLGKEESVQSRQEKIVK